MRRLDLRGQRFGRLIVTEFAYSKRGRVFWHCVCDCGSKKVVMAGHLTRKKTRSCGCLKGRPRMEHKSTYHPLFFTWRSMIRRCSKRNHKSWPAYGGRGISVCQEWATDPRPFISWAEANGWRKSYELHRINNNGNYSPDNCEFIPSKQHKTKHGAKFIPMNAYLSFGL